MITCVWSKVISFNGYIIQDSTWSNTISLTRTCLSCTAFISSALFAFVNTVAISSFVIITHLRLVQGNMGYIIKPCSCMFLSYNICWYKGWGIYLTLFMFEQHFCQVWTKNTKIRRKWECVGKREKKQIYEIRLRRLAQMPAGPHYFGGMTHFRRALQSKTKLTQGANFSFS